MFRVTFDYEKEEDKYKVIGNSIFVCFVGVFIYTLLFGIVYSFVPFDYALYVLIYGCVFSLHYLYGYICRVFLDNKLSVLSGFISTMFMTEKKTNVVMYSTLISAAVNVVLGFVMTKVFGLHGATIALGTAFAVLLIMRIFQAKKYFGISNIGWYRCCGL